VIRTVRLAVVLVGLAVGLSMVAAPVAAGGDGTPLDGLGDDGVVTTNGSNVEVGGPNVVRVGTDGVAAGGGDIAAVGPTGVELLGQGVGPGEDAATNGSSPPVEAQLGGPDGLRIDGDGLTVAGRDVVPAGPGGVDLPGEGVGPGGSAGTPNPFGATTLGLGAAGEGLTLGSDPPRFSREAPVGNGIDGDADRGVTGAGEDGSTLVVEERGVGGDAQVQCLEGATSYCEKSGNVSLAVVGIDYEGYNRFDSTNRTGSFGDTFALRVAGERVGTASVNTSDNPAATLVGKLGGVGFGIFG
jgi:hypothetical protein